MRDDTSKMPTEIGETYDGLYREVSWYRRTLEMLYDLFVDKTANVELFNDFAPDFFGTLQRTLVDSLIVQLGRMTDSEKNRSQSNLSFKRLLSLIDSSTFTALNSKVSAKLDELLQHGEAAQKHRHKRVAHSDVDVALASVQLPDILIIDFRKALQSAHDILNAVLVEFDSCTCSDKVAPAPGATHSLLLALKRAKELKDADDYKYFMGFERNATRSQ